MLRLVGELDVGIEVLLVNHKIHRRRPSDPGGIGENLGEADLLDPEAGLVLEFDGEDHRHPAQRSHDIAKQEAFEDEGLVVGHFSSADLDTPRIAADRIARLRRLAKFLPPRDRTWVAVPPSPRINQVMQQRWAESRRAG